MAQDLNSLADSVWGKPPGLEEIAAQVWPEEPGYTLGGAAKDVAGGFVAGIGEGVRMTGRLGRELFNRVEGTQAGPGFTFPHAYDLRPPGGLEQLGTGMIEGAPTSGVEGVLPTIARGTGSSLAFLAQAGPAALLGGPAVGTAAVAYFGGMTNGGQEFFQQLSEDPSDESKAWEAFAVGFGVGTSEAVPLGGILGRINKVSGGGLMRAMMREMVVEGAEEFVQEGGQTLASDIIAAHLREDEVPYFEAITQTITDPEKLKGAAKAGALGAVSVLPLSGGATLAQTVLHSRASQQAAVDASTDKGPEAAGEPEAQPEAAPLIPDPDVVTAPEGFTGEPLIGGEKPQVEPLIPPVEGEVPTVKVEEGAAERPASPALAPEESYPVAAATVDARTVRPGVPNLSSIEDPTVLPGVREVPMAAFTLDEAPMPTDERTLQLAREIEESGEINPLIVGVDEKGPYIIEGAHRYDALKALGAKSFPAVVAVEAGQEPTVEAEKVAVAPTPEEIAAEGETIEDPLVEPETLAVEEPAAEPEAVEVPAPVEEQTGPVSKEPVAEIRAEDEDARLEVAAEEAGVTSEEFVRKMAEPKPGVEFTFAGPPPIVGLELGNLLKGKWGASKAVGKKFFTASGNLPTSAFESRIRRDAKVRAANQDVRFAAMDFRSAASKVYGRREMKPEQMAAIDMALRNDKLVDSLPEPLRVPVRALRRHVDALSQALVSEGVVEGDLAARILTPDEGKGTGLGVYLTRSYRVFDDPDWAREGPEGELVTKATPEIIARAKSLLRREYKGRSEEEIEGLLRKLLFVGQEADSPIALLKRGKLGHKDLSILRGRKEIAPEIRALWGEYEDPLVNYARSVTKMSHLIANHQFLEEVAAAGSEEGWLLRPEDGPRGRFAVQIAAEASEVMEPLNGYWTSPEIKKAFEDAEGARKVLGAVMRTYMKLLSATKISKTVLSHVTHLRNVTGNVGFVVANAHWRLGKMSGAFKGVLTDTGLVKSEEWRAAYRRALELGVIHESANANELRDMIQDSVQFDVAEAIEEHGKINLKSLTKRGLNATMRLYRLEDDFWKLYAFENEKARYRKAQPGWSEEQVEAHAAKLVRNLYPTYSQVPEAIRLLRRSPLVGTFVSFPWEVARTAKNTVLTIQDELTSDNVEVRKIGAQRLVGTIMAATSTAALAAALRFIMGLDREEDENAREFMPPWSRNSDILWVGQSKDGDWNYVDAGYTDPYSYLKSPLKAFLRGEDWKAGVADAVWEASAPFIGTEILTGAVLDLRERMKSDDFNALPLRDQSEEVFDDLAKAFEPGSVTQLRRMRKAFSGEVERYGRAYDPKVEVFNSLAGVRINTLDIQQSLSFLAFEYQSTLQGAQKIVSREASRRGEVPESDLRDAYDATEAARRRAYEGMRRVVSAASSLGESEDEIRQTLSGSLSRKEVHHVLSGTYQPYIPSSSFLSTYMKGSDEERRAELIGRAQAIRGYSLEAREGATNDG